MSVLDDDANDEVLELVLRKIACHTHDTVCEGCPYELSDGLLSLSYCKTLQKLNKGKINLKISIKYVKNYSLIFIKWHTQKY